MTDAGTGEGAALVERARALAPGLAARSAEGAAAGRVADDLAHELAEAGLYRVCLPEAYGGFEAPPCRFVEVVEELARGDGAPAWCVFVGVTATAVMATGLPEATAREVFADPSTITCGVFAPRGTGEPATVDGVAGLRVNGRWAWGSGSSNARWIVAGCLVPNADAPGARPRLVHVVLPADALVIHDTWHVSGLEGTGSNEFEARDVFVPRPFVIDLTALGAPRFPIDAFPTFGFLAVGIAAVTLGLARAAIDALVELAGAKTPDGSARPLAMRAGTQRAVAEAEAEVRAARALLLETIARGWSEALALRPVSVEVRRDLRLACTHTVRSCASAVDRMYELGGGSSVFLSSPLQRIFRDVHVATQHMMVSPASLELVGRLYLDVETDVSLL